MVRKNVYGSENCPAAAEKYVAVRAVFYGDVNKNSKVVQEKSKVCQLNQKEK